MWAGGPARFPPELMVRHVLGCVPPHEWPTRVEAMDAVLRRLESARQRQPARRGAAGGGPAARACTSPGGPARARGLIAPSCTGSIRSRAGAIAPISSRTRWACASTSWSCSNTSTRRPRVLQQALKEQEWSDPESGMRPVLGPDPAADRARRLAGSRRLERRLRARQGPVGAGRAGARVVPLEQGRHRDA